MTKFVVQTCELKKVYKSYVIQASSTEEAGEFFEKNRGFIKWVGTYSATTKEEKVVSIGPFPISSERPKTFGILQALLMGVPGVKSVSYFKPDNLDINVAHVHVEFQFSPPLIRHIKLEEDEYQIQIIETKETMNFSQAGDLNAGDSMQFVNPNQYT